MEKQSTIVKLAFVRKVRGKGWCVFGHKKTKDGKYRNFGCYKTKAEAKKRLGQLYFFKGQGAIDDFVNISDDLDKKGLFHFADMLMDSLEKIISTSLGEPVDDKPASIAIGKIAALLEKRGEIILSEQLDSLLPTVLDIECGIDCLDCPDTIITASLGCRCNITKQMPADKLYKMATKYQQMYSEGMIDENSFEYRKFRELRFLLKQGFIFPPPEGQDVPKNVSSWWNFFEEPQK